MPGFAARLDSIRLTPQCAYHNRPTAYCTENGTEVVCRNFWFLEGWYEEFTVPEDG